MIMMTMSVMTMIITMMYEDDGLLSSWKWDSQLNCCLHSFLLFLFLLPIARLICFQILTCPNETTKVFNQVSASGNMDYIVAVADTNVVCIWKRLRIEDASSHS